MSRELVRYYREKQREEETRGALALIGIILLVHWAVTLAESLRFVLTGGARGE